MQLPDLDQLAALREDFTGRKIGKKPKITCRVCSKADARVCGNHKKKWCPKCKQHITEEHMHIDFVGHAHVTERLLDVDPMWNWEPLATDPSTGAPLLDHNGGLWIKLTVGGMTRIGYGGSDGKKGDDAIKEAIGDAIKNAAMRFGIALKLWQKETDVEPETPQQLRARARRAVKDQAAEIEQQKATVRGEIAAAGAQRGWSAAQTADEFTAWSGPDQLDIRRAELNSLEEYLAVLQDNPPDGDG
jgi:hypothetical protein